MKTTLITAALVVITAISFGQKSPKDSTQKKDTLGILTYQQVLAIGNIIQLQMSGKVEVKNDTWQNDVLKILYSSLQVIPVPQEPQPKQKK